MHGSLRHKSIGQRQSKNTANEASAAQKEEVPMETSRLLQWILTRLSRKRGDVVIIVEQQHHQEPKRHCHKDPLHIQVPEVDDPIPGHGRLECANGWYAIDFRVCESTRKPIESDPEEGWEGKGVVCEYASDPGLPERATAELLKTVDGTEIQNSDDDGEVAACDRSGFEEVDELFNALDCE